MQLSNKELGKYLKDIRESLGYSTHDVNKLCEISQSYISLMENGKRRPSPIILKKLASAYFLDYIDLYEKAGYIDLAEYEKSDQLKKIGAIPLSEIDTIKIPILRNCKSRIQLFSTRKHHWLYCF